EPDGDALEPDVLAQPREAHRPRGQGRRAQARPRRRDRPRPYRRDRDRGKGEDRMTGLLIFGLYIFVLAGFVGYQVITNGPPLRPTPLMAATNAISGISLVGSLVLAGGHTMNVAKTLGVVAVTAATINAVGGFIITDRMLRMFKKRKPGQKL